MKYFFPCSNGVCCYNNGKVSIAIVTSEGSKKVASYKTKNKVIFCNYFFIRGLQYFFCGLVALFSSFNLSLNLSNFENSKVSKSVSNIFIVSARYFFFLISIAFGFLFSYLYLGYLPAKLSFLIIGSNPNMQLRALIIALIKVFLFFILLLVIKILPSMQYFFMFNGATSQVLDFHVKKDKTQNTLKNNHKISKNGDFSHYTPLNYLNFLIFTLLFSIFMVSLISINIGFLANLAVNLAIILACIGLSYELLLLLERSSFSSRLFCIFTCWFVCKKPNITSEEIAKVVKLESDREILQQPIENDKVALSAVITEMESKLQNAKHYEKSDVDWIIATVLGKNRAEIKLISAIEDKDYREIMAATERRAKGEPLSSIFGFVDFYGLRFDVNKKVLSPRLETELLVDEALKIIKDKKMKEVCDLCTGSGAIAISIARNCSAKVYGLDISKNALQVATNNAKKLGAKVEFVESDIFSGLKKLRKFDIIISNPPYIPSQDIEKLDEEVKNYDPLIALDGGQDGLDFYRKIISAAPKRLNKNGVLMFEVGRGQAASVKKMMKENGFIETHTIKDYNKIERIVYGKIRS